MNLLGAKSAKAAYDRQRYLRLRGSILAANAAYRATHPEKWKVYIQRYRTSPKGKATLRRMRQALQEHYAARQAVRYALRVGDLARPTRCERCGKRRKAQAHHPDYSKPLEVVWLCRPCHNESYNTLKGTV